MLLMQPGSVERHPDACGIERLLLAALEVATDTVTAVADP
jgi:hypothetical protein